MRSREIFDLADLEVARMTVPVHRDRWTQRRGRFDLRTTAMFFLLLAVLLCVLAFVARTAAGIVERRPVWAVVLAILGLAGALRFRSRWHRLSAGGCARRAARALQAAAETASAGLDAAVPHDAAGPAVRTGAPDRPSGDPVPAGPGWGVEGPAPEPAPTVTVPLDTCGEDHPGTGWAGLDPDGFEQAVAELCVRDDCREAEVVGGAGDLGADVVAVAPDGRRVVIQCKYYGEDHKVGSQDVQRFGGTCFTIHEADVAAVVTTSDFTEPALEYARQCGIVCVNGEDLNAWHRGTGPSPWHRPDAGS
ncbi:restriction endonuclease [Streptomyces echinatus]|uniref:restriction endonuclease n=1 Tax=Streptomyces echinatus TaxID=67293 RepID=UPI0037939103